MISTYPWKDGAKFLIPGMLLLATIAIIPASAQQEQGYTSEFLFVALFSTGDALVEYDVSVEDPLDEEIRIELFGEDVSNLIVVDYEDNVIEFETGDSPDEIVLNTPGASNIRISYTTQDFLSKIQRDWIFTLNSTIGFTVRLPPDSTLTDWGESPPTIRTLADQSQLLTFKPGNIRFIYVIGTLGTEEQANIVIRAAQTTISQVRNTHADIVLAEAEDLLQRAIDAREDGRFADAETMADRANDAAIAAGRDYEAAQSAMEDADGQIDSAAGEGRDVTSARQLLEQANSEFAAGSYVPARTSAQNAVAAIGDAPESQIPASVIIAASVAAAGGVGALVFLRMRKQSRPVPQMQKEVPKNPAKTAPVFRPAVQVKEKEMEPAGVEEPLQENSMPLEPGTIPDSQIDRSILGQIVGRIIEERPHLRPEDQQVLRFLAEKEGAAFESEIRTKFQLPKTTIWRLVKRLEREELVEIRKAGGQNLIKLKFEDKMP